MRIRYGTASFLLGIAILSTSASVGCGKGRFSDELPSGDQLILRIAAPNDPEHFDPALLQDVSSTDEMQQVYEGLLSWSADLTIQPCLATSWDVSHSGTTYTFHLRKGVQFSNGDPFTATDVKFSIERACNPALHSTVAKEYMGDIVGVDEMCAGTVSSIGGIKVLDPYTVEIDITHPVPYFLGKFSYNSSWILDHKIAPFNKEILKINQMIGTGPFVVSKYTVSQDLELGVNPHYWGGKPALAGVRYVIAKEPMTRINLFQTNKVDICDISSPEATDLKSQPNLSSKIVLTPRPAVEYFAMNSKVYAPFANIHVRRAFAMAINPDEIINKIGGGIFSVANGILPPKVLGYRDNPDNLPYDPARAKKELALGGVYNGASLPPLKIFVVATDLGSTRDGQTVQSEIEHNLGVNIQVVPTDLGTLIQQVNQNALPSYLLDWFADYPDPQDFLSLMFTTKGEENHSNYSNSEVDALCKKADSMVTDQPGRLRLYAKAEDLILQDAPWRVLGFWRSSTLISPRVKGLQNSIDSFARLNTVSLSQ